MKSIRFKVGDRVRVSNKRSWAKSAIGTISYPPDVVVELEKDYCPWEGHHRLIDALNETVEFFYVFFDEGQHDSDGHGPYMGSEIEADMLEKVE
jgi:hypothetical protein